MSLNSLSSPPSFDAIFNNQQSNGQSSSTGQGNADPPVTDEPQTFVRRDSSSSRNSDRGTRGRRASGHSEVVHPKLSLGGRLRRDPPHQDSLSSDFDPEASSTLIATAQKPSSIRRSDNELYEAGFRYNGYPSFDNQKYDVSGWPTGDDGMAQYAMLPPSHHPSQSPFNSSHGVPSPLGVPGTADTSNESFLSEPDFQQSAFATSEYPSANDNASWGGEFVGQAITGDFEGSDFEGNRRASWIADDGDQGSLNDAVRYGEEQINELQRIISNASSHGSHHSNPADLSPYQNEQFQQQQALPAANSEVHQHGRNDSLGHGRHDSQSSRSPSPFSQQQHQQQMSSTVSPPVNTSFHRANSSSVSGSPFMNKPISPPALIIPNNASPSPQLPPIITTAATNTNVNNTQLPSQTQSTGMSSLFPPANPLFTGMAGISPIAPNVDGPQIFVQPSTPISGLKEGRGVFDAAIRRAGALAQASSQQGHGQEQTQGRNFHLSQQAHPLPQDSSASQQQNSGNPSQPNPALVAFLSQQWPQYSLSGGSRTEGQQRPRAKSDSYMSMPSSAQNNLGGDSFDRQALMDMLMNQSALDIQQQHYGESFSNAVVPQDQWQQSVDAWRTNLPGSDVINGPNPSATLDPRTLPGSSDQGGGQNSSNASNSQHAALLHQFQILQQAHSQQRSRLAMLDTTGHALSSSSDMAMNGNGTENENGIFKYQPGEFSPTSLNFYASLGVTPGQASQQGIPSSAPGYATTFNLPPSNAPFDQQVYPQTAGPSIPNFNFQQQQLGPYGIPSTMMNPAGMLGVPNNLGGRRRSFAEGTGAFNHPAAGAGTPGYGIGFAGNAGSLDIGSGRVRGLSPGSGHRRSAKSEDLGRSGTGWGVGGGGSTADFLQSITNPSDGTLLPPTSRGRASSHSRHSSVSSNRSVSPALSISSQGSTFSNSNNGRERMSMSDIHGSGSSSGVAVPQLFQDELQPIQHPTSGRGRRVAKQKVTSLATEVASGNRRTNSGIFQCPVIGCHSTFTRHFNLKGHLRSHNDERPYKCLYDGCPKATIGFARQHDCKRHMLLHEGLRPFECEGCNKKFARLDALTRHHKSEQGQECALTHPLPTNPDGSYMSESQYKHYKGIQSAPSDLGDHGRSSSGGGAARRKSAGGRSTGGDSRPGGFSGYKQSANQNIEDEDDDDEDELRSLGDEEFSAA